jgi:MFS family permease
MTLPHLPRLAVAAAGLRGTDQIMLATVPLTVAALFGAGPDLVGMVVAAQSLAWALVSLPGGVVVDRHAPRGVLVAALVLAVIGLLSACLAIAAGSVPAFALAAFAVSAATVVGLLAEGATVQALVAREHLGMVNGRLQVVQSVATLAAPLLAGGAIALGAPLLPILLAAALALLGVVAVNGLSATPAREAPRRRLHAEIGEGLAFAWSEPRLRAIIVCALFWNVAFFAFVAVAAPWALTTLALGPAEIGAAQAGMGLGALAASLIAGPALARLEPRAILLFGPASSAAAMALALLLAPAGGAPVLFAAWFALGFGPILWFVTQTTIRQLVTPKGLLGRVGAVVTIAIYGVRSLGALAGGALAAGAGPEAALVFVVALFLCSTAVIPLSILGRLRALPEAR